MKVRFYIYIFRGKTGQIALSEMEHVADLEVERGDDLAAMLNAQLPAFLKQHGLRQFIPLKRPSMDQHEDGSFSVCYYMNQKAHDIVYSAYPEFVMMPNAGVLQELDDLYDQHGLDGWDDPRVHVD